MGDYEVWHAMHNDCPPHGCGSCVVEDIEWDDGMLDSLATAAALVGEPIDVFIHKSIVAGMEHLREQHS